VGEDRSGAGIEGSLRALIARGVGGAAARNITKPPPDRLYGRGRSHRLRPRQNRLLEVTLPRLALAPEQAADPRSAFPSQQTELWLEVGFGAGEHALAQIAEHPEAALIACEVFDNGICSLLSRLVPEGEEATAPLPANLRLWTGDARTLLRRLPHACLDRLFLLFPDPWPKSRHAKRRFVHPALLPVLGSVMKPGADWRVASDDPTYQAWVGEVMASQTLFDVLPHPTERPAGWPSTRYEVKALREGRTPVYWRFIRR
jgi:tRNA (guanine-N7-)-methyltransferase